MNKINLQNANVKRGWYIYSGADKSLARTGFKSTRVGFSVDFYEYWYWTHGSHLTGRFNRDCIAWNYLTNYGRAKDLSAPRVLHTAIYRLTLQVWEYKNVPYVSKCTVSALSPKERLPAIAPAPMYVHTNWSLCLWSWPWMHRNWKLRIITWWYSERYAGEKRKLIEISTLAPVSKFYPRVIIVLSILI
jgi:hypothetical protein